MTSLQGSQGFTPAQPWLPKQSGRRKEGRKMGTYYLSSFSPSMLGEKYCIAKIQEVSLADVEKYAAGEELKTPLLPGDTVICQEGDRYFLIVVDHSI